MELYRCERCGRELESSIEPERCPCGSENLTKEQKKSRLEQIIDKYVSKNEN